MADIEVEFVTVERRFWSGTATMVVAKTTEGEIGIQAGHEPLLGELDAGGTVTVYTDEGKKVAAVQGGFLSVTAHKVSILGEAAEWSDAIDRSAAEKALSEAGDDAAAAATARGRLRAIEKAGA
ncbi:MULTISPECIES: F0F1 ATP synthase subunit epsilon [Dietzia]|uniref:ATP synthase epsilon chain n=1 Tax=Dietzia lutea TaxID=546160 RepID=A0A2S1R7S5_9ACTN|nr:MULTISPECIES: F0F1 ATP synthase subunit epsilon [Dietzia]AWH92340.1 F0F1 ATP synthase subunit epsilon [Dietzia lutea]MBS7547122.1 F0F1 ATP synthase subunit epsilon [Dietzia massiliensis]MCT2264659.1 F0F1 ATP synthase subunit epsilon [Dietzia cinnamea]